MHAYRSHNCGALRASDTGASVRLSGWIHRKRDHGGLLFIDLRDHYGITQCVVTPSNPHFARLERIRVESVICLTGEVVARDAGTGCAVLFGEEGIVSGHDLTAAEDKLIAAGKMAAPERASLSLAQYQQRATRWYAAGADGIHLFNESDRAVMRALGTAPTPTR